MSYVALYRKFRPDGFEQVKGQDHIVTTLKNQIQANRLGHAYLFCGTRGTGKTSIAKIFAKAVNCEHPVDGSPCNECATCKAIAAGSSMNVIEIDAASNNGVDNIREIREEVQYSPADGKYKVYIIDEVHMLSIGAFNALLKTLEEPPSYVIFILATTEAHKIPITILSRCQRYDFRRISIDTITMRLAELMDKEQVETEEKALRYISKAADGSMRDALSLLDQCLAFYMGQKLTYENVLEVLGAVDTEVFSQLLRLVIAGDSIGCIHKLEEVILSGRELTQFVTDFTWYLRNLLLMKTGDAGDILDMSKERLQSLKEEADTVELESIMRYIRLLSELSGQMRYAVNKRVLIEIALIKLTKPQMEHSLDALINRVEQIEKTIEQGLPVASEAGTVRTQMVSKEETEQEQKKVSRFPVAVPEDVQLAVDSWHEIERELSGACRVYLKSARFVVAGEDNLGILLEDETGYTMLSQPDKVQELQEAIEKTIQKAVKVRVELLKQEEQTEDYTEIERKIHMEIEEEDF